MRHWDRFEREAARQRAEWRWWLAMSALSMIVVVVLVILGVLPVEVLFEG
jgi:hypothetical protein